MKKLFDKNDFEQIGSRDVEIKEEIKQNIETEIKPIVKVENDELFNEIKNIVTNAEHVTNGKIYFKVKGKLVINVDDTEIMPNATVLLKPSKFEENYFNQLEKIIYNDKENLDENCLYTLLRIYSFISKGHYPVTLNSVRFRSFNVKINKVMNRFMIKNRSVIRSMWTMLSGVTT